jgi:hypothetical protein
MEEAAHRWAKTLAAWPIVADRMVELLGHMPGHRTARKSVLRTMNEATVRANAAKDSAGG